MYNRKAPQTSPPKTRLKGLLDNGVWKCMCDPRLPAEHFQTKNGGKNHGRWFYTCQKSKPAGCGFFLWDDDAKVREEAALLSHTRTDTPAEPPVQPPAPKAARSAPVYEIQDEGGEEFDWMSDLVGLEGREDMPPPIVTPRKAAKTTVVTSPGRRTSEWPAPRDEPFTPSRHRTPGDRGDRGESSAMGHGGLRTPQTGGYHRENAGPELADSPNFTPTPSRYRDVGLAAGGDSALTDEILAILRERSTRLDDDAAEKLRLVLNRHVLKMQGVAMGRDVARLAIKAKETRIAELEYRIAELESERETDRLVIKTLKRTREA